MDNYDENNLNGRMKLLVVLGVIAFVVIVVFLISKHRTSTQSGFVHIAGVPTLPTYNVAQKFSVGSAFTSAVPYSQDTFLTSNGRVLITYDFKTAEASLVSPDETTSSLQGVDSMSVSPDKQYILFHQQVVVPGGLLATVLQQKTLSSSADYWWVYNTINKTFQPLPQGTVLAKFFGDEVAGLKASGTSEAITTYSADELKTLSTINVPGNTNFFPVRGGFLLQTPANNVLFTKNGVVSSTVLRSVILTGISPDGQNAVGVTTGATRQLVQISLKNYSKKVVDTNVVGLPLWLDSGTAFYGKTPLNQPATNPTFSTYSVVTGKLQLWKFASAIGGNKTSYTPIAYFGDGTAIISNGSVGRGNNYLVGAGLAAIKQPDSSYSAAVSAGGVLFSLGYDPSEASFNIALNPKVASVELPAVYKQLKLDGYNPYLSEIKFLPL